MRFVGNAVIRCRRVGRQGQRRLRRGRQIDGEGLLGDPQGTGIAPRVRLPRLDLSRRVGACGKAKARADAVREGLTSIDGILPARSGFEATHGNRCVTGDAIRGAEPQIVRKGQGRRIGPLQGQREVPARGACIPIDHGDRRYAGVAIGHGEQAGEGHGDTEDALVIREHKEGLVTDGQGDGLIA